MGFVSFIFAAAAVSWGTTLLGINPISREVLKPAQNTNSHGLDFLISLDGHILFGGLLYGVVLICFYWIYAEYLTTQHIPRRPWILPLDFIALSFMTGAAATWVEEKAFVFLAAGTVIFLLIRFGLAAEREWSEKIPQKQRIMTHITLVYLIFIAILAIMSLGQVVLPRENPIPRELLYYVLYWGVVVAMILGIVTTTLHALYNAPYALSTALTLDILPASEYGTPVPTLVPDYRRTSSVLHPPESLMQIASDVRDGELRFRNLLRLRSGTRTLSPHLSRVHSLRDVETQAFIMAHQGSDSLVRQIRSMWVYLAHWFDDLFDYHFPDQLAQQALQGEFRIDQALEALDESYASVWRSAIAETQKVADWNANLLEMGMRRLMLGGPLFSPRCNQDRKKIFSEWHRDIVVSRLKLEGENASVLNLIESTPSRHLHYTTKVVVEFWDSFEKNAKFSTSLLMDYFYAPGLLHHDFDAEAERREAELTSDDTLTLHSKTLQRASAQIVELPEVELEVAMRPVPMFFRCFLPIIQHNLGSDFLNVYRDVLLNDRVLRLMGWRAEDFEFLK